jgi:hypothetical protein
MTLQHRSKIGIILTQANTKIPLGKEDKKKY